MSLPFQAMYVHLRQQTLGGVYQHSDTTIISRTALSQTQNDFISHPSPVRWPCDAPPPSAGLEQHTRNRVTWVKLHKTEERRIGAQDQELATQLCRT